MQAPPPEQRCRRQTPAPEAPSAEAQRQKARRDATIERLAADLARLANERARLTVAAAKKTSADEHAKAQLGAAHPRVECALRDHRALGRYLRQTKSGRPRRRSHPDRGRGAAGSQVPAPSTSSPTLSTEDVALGYKNPLEAERGFRDLKGILELPGLPPPRTPHPRTHHPLPARAAADLERQAGWRTLSRELNNRLQLVTLDGATGTATQTTARSDTQRAIHTARSNAPPPPITVLTPA